MKLYPAGATTNSDAGVTDLAKCAKTLEAMQESGMPLLVHGEVTDPAIDLFDREKVFIDRVMTPLRRDFPALKVVFEHITTKDAAEYVREASGPIAAPRSRRIICCTTAMRSFRAGFGRTTTACRCSSARRIAWRWSRRRRRANPRFFLGTDSAPHPKGLKEHACGCAGCYTALHALELYTEAFDNAGALDKLEGFASFHGPDFYTLPRSAETVTLRRETWTLPAEFMAGDEEVVPLRGGESIGWRQV